MPLIPHPDQMILFSNPDKMPSLEQIVESAKNAIKSEKYSKKVKSLLENLINIAENYPVMNVRQIESLVVVALASNKILQSQHNILKTYESIDDVLNTAMKVSDLYLLNYYEATHITEIYDEVAKYPSHLKANVEMHAINTLKELLETHNTPIHDVIQHKMIELKKDISKYEEQLRTIYNPDLFSRYSCYTGNKKIPQVQEKMRKL